MPKLVYCAGGNRRFAEIALDAGFSYGARLPDTVYFPLAFADQDWKQPNRRAYMAGLAQHRPHCATVLDWERQDQLGEVLDWAEEAAQYAHRVMVIPKVQDGIDQLPRRVGGADIMLGYSVPTRFGGTELGLWQFAGWPVHLLGGQPQHQQRIWRYLAGICEVVSVDGNVAQKLANGHCQFWVPGTARGANNRYWPTLEEADGERLAHDGPYEAFRRSCTNIMAAWKRLGEECSC